jgi:hypothetical protein
MMLKTQIIYWRDIPAHVKVRVDRQRLSHPLSQRFQVAIDEAAMRAGMASADAYLAEWRASDWQEQEGDAAETAEQLVAALESEYPQERLQELVRQGGWAS